jgi:curli biogenesis system outer membrane secretion channel CsgG
MRRAGLLSPLLCLLVSTSTLAAKKQDRDPSPATSDTSSASASGANAVATGTDPAWAPHLENKNGESRPLRNPKELKDKDWLSIHYGEYPGYRSRLGLMVSEEKTAYSPKYKNEFAKMIVGLSGRPKTLADPQNHLEDLVRQALVVTNRFNLVERDTSVDALAAERALADSGRADAATVARAGRMEGAEYVVRATLIELNPEKETKELKGLADAASKGGGAFGDLGLKTRVAFCRMNLRVIRSETGEIVSDQTVDGSCLTTGVSGMSGVGLRMMGSALRVNAGKEPPISDAMQSCANKAAYYVAMSLQETAWQGTVAGVAEHQLTINGGANVGLREGMTLTLLARGEDVVDPETHEVIGAETSEIGQVRVVSVQPQLATCEILQGGQGAKKGDLVRREVQKH